MFNAEVFRMGNGVVKPKGILFHFGNKYFIAEGTERIFLKVKETGQHNESDTGQTEYNQRLAPKKLFHVLSPILFLKGMCNQGTSFFDRMSFFIFLKYVIIDKHGNLCLIVLKALLSARVTEKEEKHYEYFSPFDFSG